MRSMKWQKGKTGGKCGLSRVVFSWMSSWRQMRNTNAVFSVYTKELNQVWDYLSWSWGPCIPSKRTHISGHCSPWPWTAVGFTEPHDKWVFLADWTSPSTPFAKITCSACHSTLLNHTEMHYLSWVHQSKAMKHTDKTLNKTISNIHMSKTHIHALKHTEKPLLDNLWLLPPAHFTKLS